MKHMKRTMLPIAILLLSSCTVVPAPSGTGSGSLSSTASSSVQGAMTYESPLGYAIDVPDDWTVVENDEFVGPTYDTVGTSFVHPSAERHSALYEAKINVATLPACPAQENGVSEEINGTTFTRTDFTDAGAGNRYGGSAYAAEHGGSCVVATILVHWCGLGPDCGPDRQEPFSFDETAAVLRRVLGSLRLS